MYLPKLQVLVFTKYFSHKQTVVQDAIRSNHHFAMVIYDKLKINFIDLSERYLHCQHVFLHACVPCCWFCLFFKTAFLTLCVCVCVLMLCYVRVCSLIPRQTLKQLFFFSYKHFTFSLKFSKLTKFYNSFCL